MLSFRRARLALTAGLALLCAALGQGQSTAQPAPAAPAPPSEGGLPRGAIARLGPVHYPRPEPARCVAVSADHRLVAFSPDAQTVVLREVWTGKELHRMEVPDAWPQALAFAPDGKTLASAGRQVLLWDVATGKEVRRLGTPAPLLKALAFAPDGNTVAAGGHGTAVRLWDVATGKELRALDGHGNNVFAMAFSPDGQLLAVASWDNTLRLWDVGAGKVLGVCKGHEHWPLALAFSPDGKWLASGSWANTVRLWDVGTAREVRSFHGHADSVLALAFAPDGKALVSAGKDRTVRVWDVTTGKERERDDTHARAVPCLSVGRDGRLAVGDQAGEVEVWAWRPGGEFRQVAGGAYEAVFAAEFTADGKSVVTVGQDGTTRTWDAATGKQVRVRKAGPGPLALSADGRVLTTCRAERKDSRTVYGPIVLRDVATGKRLETFPGPTGKSWWQLRPDGRVLAAASLADKEISVWGLANGRCTHRFKAAEGWWERQTGYIPEGLGALGGMPGRTGDEALAGGLCGLTFSADGRSLAAGWDHAVHVWRLDTGRSLRPFEKAAGGEGQRGGSVAFSPDGRTLATVGPDGVVRLWEVSTGQLRWRTVPVARPCGALRFSPDGRLLAVASRLLGASVRLFHFATGQEGETPTGHQAPVTCLAFSPDGTRLVSGSEDGSALLWDVPAVLGRAPPARSADLDAGWRDLASADGEKAYTAVWRLAAAKQVVPLLRERFRPAAAVDAGRVERLVADLDADDFATRESATRELQELGQRAKAALRRATARPASGEAKRRAERLLARLDTGQLPPEQLRALRAVEVLEAAGTPEARELLRSLAKDAPDAVLTQEAAAALARLERRGGNRPEPSR